MSYEKPPRLRILKSLPLRVGALFVLLLVAAALSVGYLFDRGRTEALQERELEQLRLRAERAADEVVHYINRMRADVLFLAGTPPIQGIFRAIEGHGYDPVVASSLDQWQERLEQILLAFAEARPEYSQLRLIGAANGGRELIRAGRTENGLRITPREELQQKGKRYYIRETGRLPPGAVYLSRIDLNREHGQIAEPHQPTLRAATPVKTANGGLLGVVVINLDMGQIFERAGSFLRESDRLFVADESGNVLLHPERGRAFGFEFDTPFRLQDAFPDHVETLGAALSESGSGTSVEPPEGRSEGIVYATSRAWDPATQDRQLAFVVRVPV